MLIIITLSALLLAIWYAREIYKRTLEPQWVWLSVVIGDAGYDITLGLFLYYFILEICERSLLITLVLPGLWHLLWGTPMILAELKKHFGMLGEASNFKRPRWSGKDSKWDR